jgi:hypothetical protein
LSGTPRRLKMQYPSSSNASPPVPVRYRRLLLVCALATPISLFAYRRSASSAQKKSIELAIASDGDLLAFHVSVSFVAPTPGDYPFLCTNPGHGAVMHGILHVTAR